MSEKKISKKVNIIITEEKYIEDAAAAFVKLKTEMLGMFGPKLDLNFSGFFFFDTNRLAIANQRREIFIRYFPEVPFHGKIKYTNDNLNKLDVLGREKSFVFNLVQS